LRGLAIPAGKHDIKFEFKPQGYYKGKSLTSIFSIVLLLILAIADFYGMAKPQPNSTC
jgi:uncharacterized membrane protein YfhO